MLETLPYSLKSKSREFLCYDPSLMGAELEKVIRYFFHWLAKLASSLEYIFDIDGPL